MSKFHAVAAAPTFLVGDIGGTNCRFSLATTTGRRVELLNRPAHYKCADYPTAEAAIDHYLASLGQRPPIAATVLAVAGPVEGGVVQATNMPWRLSEQALADASRGHAALGQVELINDFTALSLSVDTLTPDDLLDLGTGQSGEAGMPMAIVGAGTGFGAGLVTHRDGRASALATEGGHVGFAPTDAVEDQVVQILRRRFGRVSVERLLSGPGLVSLHAALAEIHGEPAETVAPEDIVQGAATDPRRRRTVDRFCAIYGAVAGDFALAYGARGGVFLGGGLAPALASPLQHGAFRARFEDKGRFRSYVAAIPTRIIMNGAAALRGAAAAAQMLQAS